jgi:hypothetical protein
MTERVIHFMFHLPPELRRRLAAWAIQEKLPIEELVVAILENEVQDRAVKPQPPEPALRFDSPPSMST